jgi:hypothetical protein
MGIVPWNLRNSQQPSNRETKAQYQGFPDQQGVVWFCETFFSKEGTHETPLKRVGLVTWLIFTLLSSHQQKQFNSA